MFNIECNYQTKINNKRLISPLLKRISQYNRNKKSGIEKRYRFFQKGNMGTKKGIYTPAVEGLVTVCTTALYMRNLFQEITEG